MDVAGLEKLPKTTILTIVAVLGFLTFGYATEEYEITEERLGVYRCEEHLDNPKVRHSSREVNEAAAHAPPLLPPSPLPRRATARARTPNPSILAFVAPLTRVSSKLTPAAG